MKQSINTHCDGDKHDHRLVLADFTLLLAVPAGLQGQSGSANKAIDFNPQMPFSNGVVAGNTLYVAGQQGPGPGWQAGRRGH